MQRNYDETVARLSEKERLKSHLDWLKQLPVKQMVDRGWLPAHKDRMAQLDEVLRFFGIAPGIVVGRLQFDKRLRNSHGNGLKVFYEWT